MKAAGARELAGENRAKALGPGIMRRLLAGLTWFTVGSVFNQGSTLVVNVLVAHTLGRAVFGEYSIVQSTIAALALIAQLAMSYTATKFVAELRLAAPGRAGRILALCATWAFGSACLASASFLIVSRWLAVVVYRAPHLAPVLAIGSALLFLTVLNTFLLGGLAGFEAYRVTGASGIVTGSLYVCFCLVGVHEGGLRGLVAGMAASSLVQALALIVIFRRECRAQGIELVHRDLWEERGVVLHFALPAALAGFSQMSAVWLASTILARQPNGFSSVAAFAAANTFGIAVLFIPNMINNVGMSLLNSARGRGDLGGIRTVFWSTVKLNVAVAVSGSAFCALAAPQLMSLFGREFTGDYGTLYVILLSTVPSALWYAAGQVIGSSGRMWRVLMLGVLPRDLALIVAASFFAPRSGALGLAAAVTLGWIFGLVAMIPSCLRFLSPHSGSRAAV